MSPVKESENDERYSSAETRANDAQAKDSALRYCDKRIADHNAQHDLL